MSMNGPKALILNGVAIATTTVFDMAVNDNPLTEAMKTGAAVIGAFYLFKHVLQAGVSIAEERRLERERRTVRPADPCRSRSPVRR